MIQIRRGVFETNSSSTHSICIAKRKDTSLVIPDSLHFASNDFEWEHRRFNTSEEKASYLYASVVSIYDEATANKVLQTIKDMLEGEGVRCAFDTPIYHHCDGELVYCENADVDHAGEGDHRRFVELTVGNKARLLRYLFSPLSFVTTGNDNDMDDVSIRVKYPHESFYKGNSSLDGSKESDI